MRLEERLKFGEEDDFGDSEAVLDGFKFTRHRKTDYYDVDMPVLVCFGSTPRDALIDLFYQLNGVMERVRELLSEEDAGEER